MSTTLTLHLTPAFLTELTGSSTGTGGTGTQNGVWAYLWNNAPPSDVAASPLLPAGTPNNFTPLILAGNLTSNVTLGTDGNYDVTVALTDSSQSTVTGGAIYLLVQSENPASQTSNDLTTLIGNTESNIQPNVQIGNYGYATFEYSLQNAAADLGDLTAIPGFAQNLGVKISYTGGTSASRGYNITGAALTTALTAADPAAALTYPTSSTGTPYSPLDGQTSMVISPSNGNFGAALYPSSNWSTYINAFSGLTDVSLSGVTNGEPDASSIWHNSQYYSYTVRAVTLADGVWGLAGTYFEFSPTASSQTKGYILISEATLQANLYAAGQDTVTLWQDSALTQPYIVPGSGSPPGTAPTTNAFGPSQNNEWGNIFTTLFTGFTAGYWGAIAQQSNPLNRGTTNNLAGGPLNLDNSQNQSSSYAFDLSRTGTIPSYQHNDAYSEEFFNNSNVYGSAFSDNLSNGLTPSPLIPLSSPGAATNVGNIDLYAYGSTETNPYYTKPVGANYLALPSGQTDYLVPTKASTGLDLQVVGQAAGLFVRSDATVKLGIYQGNGQFTYVPVATGGNLWQTYTVTGGSGSWSVAQTGANATGTFQINDLPTPATTQNGQLYWYQLVFSDSSGDQKVFDFYATATATAGQIQTGATSVAADGGATLPANTLTATQIQLALNPATSMPSGLLTFVYNSQFSPEPAAPVAGTLTGNAFTAIDQQNGSGITGSPAPSISISQPTALAFGWTGTNNGTHTGTPTNPVLSPTYTAGLVSAYTNKINAGDIAQINFFKNGATKALPIVVQASADLDGQWQTPALTLGAGTYTVTMLEMLPDGVTAFGPQSAALTITVNTSTMTAVTDTAAHISASLDTYGANPPSAIMITDNTPLTVTVAQATADAGALAVTTNANSSAYSLDVVDSAADVAAGLTTLNALNATSHLTSIKISDNKALTLAVAPLTWASTTLTLAMTTNANGSAYTIDVVDSAAHVAAALDMLNGNSHVAQIAIADVAPRVGITYSQFTSDTVALAKMTGRRDLLVSGVTGQEYTSFEYDYDNRGALAGSKYYYTGITGQAYTGNEVDLDINGHLARSVYTGVSGQAYSSYEYDYDAGTFAGSKYFFTGITGQAYTGDETHLDVNGRLAKHLFTGVSGQAYSSFEYDYAGGVLTGSKYRFNNVANQPYTAYEQDLDSSGRLMRQSFAGFYGQAYSSYAYVYGGGIFRGSQYFFTNITGQAYTEDEQALNAAGQLTRHLFTGVTSQAYSAYEYDYYAGSFAGDKYFYTNIAGQPYTGYEDDLDTSGKLTRRAFTGVTGQSYSSYEDDYVAGVRTGSKYFTTNIAGQPYTGMEEDLNAQGNLVKRGFSGVIGQPYTAYEYDYVNGDGILSGSKYFYTNIPNQDYSSYETDLDAAGAVSLQIFNNNDGTHRIIGFQDNLTIKSVYSDYTTGGGSNETFVYTPNFGNATVTDFAAHMTGPGHDSFELPKSEFADFNSLLAQTQMSGGNAVSTSANGNGDHLTLLGVTTATLATLGADFSFV
jgi:hypothetical protein